MESQAISTLDSIPPEIIVGEILPKFKSLYTLLQLCRTSKRYAELVKRHILRRLSTTEGKYLKMTYDYYIGASHIWMLCMLNPPGPPAEILMYRSGPVVFPYPPTIPLDDGEHKITLEDYDSEPEDYDHELFDEPRVVQSGSLMPWHSGYAEYEVRCIYFEIEAGERKLRKFNINLCLLPGRRYTIRPRNAQTPHIILTDGPFAYGQAMAFIQANLQAFNQ